MRGGAGMSLASVSATQPLLSLRQVRKIYGEGAGAVAAVRGVDLDLLPGEFTLLMCLTSSVLSIYRITKIDPALVFKG